MRIGVIRGGVSPEYPISLKTGATILEALRAEGYDAIDILLDKEGILHIKGIPAGVEDLHKHIDLLWNSLHGHFGEDGKLQQLLENTGIPYTGSGPLASAIAQNKNLAREHAKSIGLDVPPSILINPEEESSSVSEITGRIYRAMAPPWVIKPVSGGSSFNTYLVHTPLELSQVVDDAMNRNEPFIVEQYIYGKEAHVSAIDGFRGQENYVTPSVEVKKPPKTIFDPSDIDKFGMHVGGTFKASEKEMLTKYARQIHKIIGAKDFSQSEFIISPRGKIYFIEVNCSPPITEKSSFALALESVGSSIKEFVRHIVGRKLNIN